MEFEVLSDNRNLLFKRKEIIVKMNYSGATPSKASLRQALAKDFKTEPNRVEISKIQTMTGKDAGKVWIKVWDDKEVEIYGKKEVPAEAPAEAK